MHRKYNEFYAVHVYLRSIRISLLGSTIHSFFQFYKNYKIFEFSNMLVLCVLISFQEVID